MRHESRGTRSMCGYDVVNRTPRGVRDLGASAVYANRPDRRGAATSIFFEQLLDAAISPGPRQAAVCRLLGAGLRAWLGGRANAGRAHRQEMRIGGSSREAAGLRLQDLPDKIASPRALAVRGRRFGQGGGIGSERDRADGIPSFCERDAATPAAIGRHDARVVFCLCGYLRLFRSSPALGGRRCSIHPGAAWPRPSARKACMATACTAAVLAAKETASAARCNLCDDSLRPPVRFVVPMGCRCCGTMMSIRSPRAYSRPRRGVSGGDRLWRRTRLVWWSQFRGLLSSYGPSRARRAERNRSGRSVEEAQRRDRRRGGLRMTRNWDDHTSSRHGVRAHAVLLPRCSKSLIRTRRPAPPARSLMLLDERPGAGSTRVMRSHARRNLASLLFPRRGGKSIETKVDRGTRDSASHSKSGSFAELGRRSRLRDRLDHAR